MLNDGKLMTLEEAKARTKNLNTMYQEEGKSNNFSAIVMGIYGSGKTTLITTSPKPILIDSFDPNGTVALERDFQKEIKNGEIVIRKFWDENVKNPTQHKLWEKQFEEDKKTGYLNFFGTYAIDSMTTWIDAIANRVSKDRGRKDPKLAIQDYTIIYDHVKDTIKSISSFNCIFILTAHLVLEQDNITGAVTAELKTYKGLKADIPLLFTEKYVMLTKPDPQKGVRYSLLTKSAGKYIASTQLGNNGRFKPEEEPDIKKLLEKAGMPVKDKPNLGG